MPRPRRAQPRVRSASTNSMPACCRGRRRARSSACDASGAVSGITLMRSEPTLVPAALDLAHRAVAKIRQNLFWAFAYNIIGIPLAALGLLNPIIAGAAMAFSSVSVVLNSLLLRRWRPDEY